MPIRVSKRHRFVFWLFRGLMSVVFYFKYKFRATKFNERQAGIKPPYLVLSPHFCMADSLLLALSFRRQIYFLANDDVFNIPVISPIIRYLVSPIPKTKAVPDVQTIKDIFTVKSQGGVVGIFPEGSTTFHGRPGFIPYSIARLISKLRVPVVFYTFDGMFFTSPRIADKVRKRRKGCARGSVKRVWMPEEFEKLTTEQIYDEVKETLYVDPYADQRRDMHRYRGRNRANYAERTCFQCPVCKDPNMYSKGNDLKCPHCGYSVVYNEYGFFESGSGAKPVYDNVYDWFNFELEYARSLDFSKVPIDAPIFTDEGETLRIGRRTERGEEVHKGTLKLYKDRIVLETKGEDLTVMLSEITELTALRKKLITFYKADGSIYRIFGKPNRSALKYIIYFYVLKGEKNEFIC